MVPSTAFIAVQASRTAPNLHWQQRELKIPQPQFLFLHIHSWQRHVLRDEQVIRLEMYHQLKTGRFRYRSRTCSSSSTIGSKETSVGVVAWAGSYADGAHTSIPAPGLGALGAGRGGKRSPLARGLAQLGLTADDLAVVSKHDTSTKANDPNESDLHERLGAAIGRSDGNPLFVVSQKSLTGHAKGGAAAFQLIG